MATANSSSFAFQPWARNEAEDEALKDILARVNFERGHFRDITEASVQEELAAEGALELSESDSEEEDEEDGAESQKSKDKPTTREDLFKAKYEMLANVRAAEQEVLYSLDFISLLLSKDAPKQGQSTMSPALKQVVPLGSLGADIWQRMPVDKSRQAEDELLATNVRMQGLQQSADDLLSAAMSLQNNVRKETQYWSQILSISEEGWNVCRIPGQQHRLGVSFGFSESAPVFSRRGIAELNASAGGNIMLERAIGSRPKCLRVAVQRTNRITGISKLPQRPDLEETTLEARIRYARDSLFDEELYHEMIRESRIIASLGVGMEGSAVRLDFGPATKSDIQFSLDLVSLDEYQSIDAISSNEQDDALAQAILLAARLLLSQAHRDRLQRRSAVPPLLSEKQKDDNPVLPILRPIMSFIMHRSALDRLNGYIITSATILEAARIENSYQLARFSLPGHVDITNTETLITLLMQPWLSEAKHVVIDSTGSQTSFDFTVETTLGYGFGSVFTLSIQSAKVPSRFDSVDDLIDATDIGIASALSKALAQTLDDDWKPREREALMIRDAGIGEKSQCVWINFDSNGKMLSLNSLNRKMVWKPDSEDSEKGFWDAKSDVL